MDAYARTAEREIVMERIINGSDMILYYKLSPEELQKIAEKCNGMIGSELFCYGEERGILHEQDIIIITNSYILSPPQEKQDILHNETVKYLEDRLRRCCHALNEIERALKGSGEFDSWIERRHKKNKRFYE